MNKRVFKSGVFISLGTFLSRVLGLLREIITARYFGAASNFDAFVVAFTIPNLFRRVLGEDMFERAFMPRFKRLKEEGKCEEACQYFLHVVFFVFFVSLFLCFIVYFFVPQLIHIISPGLKGHALNIAIKFGYRIVPFLFLISFATLFGAFLLFNGRPFLYSIAPAFMNIGVITFLVLFFKKMGSISIVFAFLSGAFLFLLFQFPFVVFYFKSLKKQCGGDYEKKGISHLFASLKEGGKIIVLSIVNKSVEVVDRLVASLVGSGAISSLWYSFRLIHLPFAFFGLALSRALAPEFSRLKGKGDLTNYSNLIEKGVLITFGILMPVTLFFLVFPGDIVSLFYKRGNFDVHSVQLTSKAFFYYSFSLLPMGFVAVLGRAYSSLEDNTIPLIVSVCGAILNIVLDFLLYSTPLKQGGIALSTALSLFLQAILLMLLLGRYRIVLTRKLLVYLLKLILVIAPYTVCLFVLKYFLSGLNGKFLFYSVFVCSSGLLFVFCMAGELWLLRGILKGE